MSARSRMVYLFAAMLLFTSIGRAEDGKRDAEVTFEVKFAEVADDVFQNLKRGGVFGDPTEGTLSAKTAPQSLQRRVPLLNDPQVLRLMEAVQNDVRTSVMQAPKLTMLNGKSRECNFTDQQTFVTGLEIVHSGDHIEYVPKTEDITLGTRLSLRSVISADQRAVKVHLNARLSDLVSSEVSRFPITTPLQSPEECGRDGKQRVSTHYIQQPRVNKLSVDRTLAIPNGHTALLTGWKKQCEVTRNVGPDILGEIPYVGSLFRKVECETHHVLVLVTPRIHVNQKEEIKPPLSSVNEQ